jgi:hypothetical protein
MAEKFAIATNQRLVVALAYDVTRDPSSNKMKHITGTRQAARLHDLAETKTDKAVGKLPLCLGMPLMLKHNVCVELGLVNGAEGVFHGFIFKTGEEPNIGTGRDPIFLHKLPAAILMRFPEADFQLEGLPIGVAPIYPVSSTFEYASPGYHKMKIKRRSFPLTNAFAITDYNAQGRTMPHLIVDLRPPPDGKISFANTYVPLSRPREGANLLILAPFPLNPVMKWQPPASIARDEKWQRILEAKCYFSLISAGYDITYAKPVEAAPNAIPIPRTPSSNPSGPADMPPSLPASHLGIAPRVAPLPSQAICTCSLHGPCPNHAP